MRRFILLLILLLPALFAFDRWPSEEGGGGSGGIDNPLTSDLVLGVSDIGHIKAPDNSTGGAGDPATYNRLIVARGPLGPGWVCPTAPDVDVQCADEADTTGVCSTDCVTPGQSGTTANPLVEISSETHNAYFNGGMYPIITYYALNDSDSNATPDVAGLGFVRRFFEAAYTDNIDADTLWEHNQAYGPEDAFVSDPRGKYEGRPSYNAAVNPWPFDPRGTAGPGGTSSRLRSEIYNADTHTFAAGWAFTTDEFGKNLNVFNTDALGGVLIGPSVGQSTAGAGLDVYVGRNRVQKAFYLRAHPQRPIAGSEFPTIASEYKVVLPNPYGACETPTSNMCNPVETPNVSLWYKECSLDADCGGGLNSCASAVEGWRCVESRDCRADDVADTGANCIKGNQAASSGAEDGVCVNTGSNRPSGALCDTPGSVGTCGAGNTCVDIQTYHVYELGQPVNSDDVLLPDSAVAGQNVIGWCRDDPSEPCTANSECDGVGDVCQFQSQGVYFPALTGRRVNVSTAGRTNTSDPPDTDSERVASNNVVGQANGYVLRQNYSGTDADVGIAYGFLFESPTAPPTGTEINNYSLIKINNQNATGHTRTTLIDIDAQTCRGSVDQTCTNHPNAAWTTPATNNIHHRGFNWNSGHLTVTANGGDHTNADTDHYWRDATNEVWRTKNDDWDGPANEQDGDTNLAVTNAEGSGAALWGNKTLGYCTAGTASLLRTSCAVGGDCGGGGVCTLFDSGNDVCGEVGMECKRAYEAEGMTALTDCTTAPTGDWIVAFCDGIE